MEQPLGTDHFISGGGAWKISGKKIVSKIIWEKNCEQIHLGKKIVSQTHFGKKNCEARFFFIIMFIFVKKNCELTQEKKEKFVQKSIREKKFAARAPRE